MQVVAFLRAVNVGRTGKLAMSDLKEMAADLKLGNPRTLLNSGNLVFETAKSPSAVEVLLNREITARFRLKTDPVVRTTAEIDRVIARNPFPKEANNNPGYLHICFLKGKAGAKELAALNTAIRGSEIAKGTGREVFIFYPKGAGHSKLTITVVERHLDTRATARNWNTVNKIAAMMAE
jgi:uncharacterized protein (DUF1697 family)